MELITAEIQDTKMATITFREKILAYIELTKPRIAFTLVLTSAAAFYLASKEFDTVLFLHAMLGITLLALGVATLNQFIERDIDGLMTRTEKRPLPTKKVSATEALIFGLLLTISSEIYLTVFVNPLTAWIGVVVIIGYVLIYTPLKTRTSISTAIGAVPGALPPLMGWTAAANQIDIGAWVLFSIIFLWQFPHFLAIAWMYREQYRNAGILMLPVVEPDGRVTMAQIVIFSLFLLPISIAPFFLGFGGIAFLIGASLLGLWMLWASVKLARSKDDKDAKMLLRVSIIYLPLIFLLLVIGR